MMVMDIKLDRLEVNVLLKDTDEGISYSRTLYYYNDGKTLAEVINEVVNIAVEHGVKRIDVMEPEGVGRIAYDNLKEDGENFGFAVNRFTNHRLS